MMFKRQVQIFYTTDPGFAVPTLASIQSIRKWPSAKNTIINIILVGMTSEQVDVFASLAKDLDVKIHTLGLETLAGFNNENFNKTHVPFTALARFRIADFIGDQSEIDILYIDGDTWFVGDPQPLLDLPAPEVGLLAAEDQSFFYANDIGKTGRNARKYFSNIGIDQKRGYFNSGLLKCRALEWAKISRKALAYLEANLAICQYHDQSALNAVAGSDRVRLSPAWNFQTAYWIWGADNLVEPKLLHFAGGGKPWMGMHQSWMDIYAEYTHAIQSHSHPLFPLGVWNAEEQAYSARAEALAALKYGSIFLYRRIERRALFRGLLNSSVL